MGLRDDLRFGRVLVRELSRINKRRTAIRLAVKIFLSSQGMHLLALLLPGIAQRKACMELEQLSPHQRKVLLAMKSASGQR